MTAFWEKVIEQSPIVALALYGSYILWRRYDRFTERTQNKLEEAEKRIREYMENAHSKLIVMAETQQRIISDNTEAMKSIQKSMERHTKIMECVMTELKETRELRKGK